MIENVTILIDFGHQGLYQVALEIKHDALIPNHNEADSRVLNAMYLLCQRIEICSTSHN